MILRSANLLSAFLLAGGWLLFVVSFFLPATDVVELVSSEPGESLLGWQASVQSLRCIFVKPWLCFLEPRLAFFLVFPFSNLFVFAFPAITLKLERESFVPALVVSVVGSMIFFIPQPFLGTRMIGYYLWMISHFVLAAGGFLYAITKSKSQSSAY